MYKSKKLFLIFTLILIFQNIGIANGKDMLSGGFTHFVEQEWAIKAVKADVSHQMGYTGSGIDIAIIDSGVRTDVFNNLNVIEQVDCLNLIDGQNGNKVCGPVKNISSFNSHGTYVASFITGKPNTKTGYPGGMAPNARIFSARVLNEENKTINPIWDDKTPFYYAMKWAIERKVDIINISIAKEELEVSELSVIQEAQNEGILIVAGSGNYGNSKPGIVELPARVSSVLTVGGLNIDGGRPITYPNSESAQYGSELDLVAPGLSAATIDPNFPQDAATAWGTSMSSPIVAGVAALYKQMYNEAEKSITPYELQNLMKENALYVHSRMEDASNVPIWNEEFGYGLVQAPAPQTFPAGSKLTPLNNFEARSLPNTKSPVLMTFRSITVPLKEKMGDWYKVTTSLGDLWTKPDYAIEGDFKIAFTEASTNMYTNVGDKTAIGNFKPVKLDHIMTAGGGRWFQVPTYKGNAWTNPKSPIINETRYDEIYYNNGLVNVYDVPGGEKTGTINESYAIYSQAYGYYGDRTVKWYKIILAGPTYKWVVANPSDVYSFVSGSNAFKLYNKDSFSAAELTQTDIYQKTLVKPTSQVKLFTSFGMPMYVLAGGKQGKEYVSRYYGYTNIPTDGKLYQYEDGNKTKLLMKGSSSSNFYSMIYNINANQSSFWSLDFVSPQTTVINGVTYTVLYSEEYLNGGGLDQDLMVIAPKGFTITKLY